MILESGKGGMNASNDAESNEVKSETIRLDSGIEREEEEEEEEEDLQC